MTWKESALSTVNQRVEICNTIYANEAVCWNAPHAWFDGEHINHSTAIKDEDA